MSPSTPPRRLARPWTPHTRSLRRPSSPRTGRRGGVLVGHPRAKKGWAAGRGAGGAATRRNRFCRALSRPPPSLPLLPPLLLPVAAATTTAAAAAALPPPLPPPPLLRRRRRRPSAAPTAAARCRSRSRSRLLPTAPSAACPAETPAGRPASSAWRRWPPGAQGFPDCGAHAVSGGGSSCNRSTSSSSNISPQQQTPQKFSTNCKRPCLRPNQQQHRIRHQETNKRSTLDAPSRERCISASSRAAARTCRRQRQARSGGGRRRRVRRRRLSRCTASINAGRRR